MIVGAKAWNWIKFPRLPSTGQLQADSSGLSHSYCGSLVPDTLLDKLINPPRRQFVNKSHCFGPNRTVCRCPLALAGARGVIWTLTAHWLIGNRVSATWGFGSVALRAKDEPLLLVSRCLFFYNRSPLFLLFRQYIVLIFNETTLSVYWINPLL